jgi:hypothetical protein
MQLQRQFDQSQNTGKGLSTLVTDLYDGAFHQGVTPKEVRFRVVEAQGEEIVGDRVV